MDSSKATPPPARFSATPGTLGAASARRDPVAMRLEAHARRRGRGRGRRHAAASSVQKIAFLGNEICPWPQRLFSRLPFEYGFNLTGAGAAPAFYTLKLNDIWDPDPAVGGQSASWTTAMGNIYNYFRVHASTFVGDFSGNQTSTNQYCAIWPSANNTVAPTYAPTTIDGLMAFPNARWKVIEAEQSLGPTSTVTVDYHCNLQDFFGIDIAGSSFGEGAYASAPGGGASPATGETFYWVISVMSTSGAAQPVNVFLYLKVVYYVESYQLMKPDNMTLSELEQISIDSKGNVSAIPFSETVEPTKSEPPATPILADMSASTFEFIEKLKASMK